MSHPEAEMVSPIMSIENDWVDYNGHLNQAYYGVLFDRALDLSLHPLGLGPEYIRAQNCSFMTVESHTCFVRELMVVDRVRIATRIVDVGDKRLHSYSEMRHADQGWLAATAEYMFLHIDMQVRRTAPWPPDLRRRLEDARDRSARLPMPERVGKRIGIPRK